MPRLLVLSQTHNQWGGIEAWMAELFPGLARSGWTVEFALAKGAQFNCPESFVNHHPYIESVRTMDGSVGTTYSRRRAVQKAIVQSAANVVMPIAIGDALPAVAELRAKGHRVATLVPLHSLHLGTLADVVNNADIIDCVGSVSGLIHAWASARLRRRGVECLRIPNGVPAALVPARVGESRRLRVGFVGRLDDQIKRVMDLAEIVRFSRAAGLELSVTIAGDGPARDELVSRLECVRGDTSVDFVGFVERDALYRDVYPSLDCLLLTSTTEGCPLSVIEAMRHGVVPVTSRYSGHATEGLLVPGINSLTFEVGDCAAAARHLSLLQGSGVLLRRMSANAATAANSYDRELMIERWSAAASGILAPSRRRGPTAGRAPLRDGGRLDRWGVPPSVAHAVRVVTGRRFIHPTGFTEWPGSLNTDASLEEAIASELDEIEAAHARTLYSEDAQVNRCG